MPSSAMDQRERSSEQRGGRYPEFAARGGDAPVEGLCFPSAGDPEATDLVDDVE